MAILEWKKFDFFNLVPNADKEKVFETIRDSEITSCTSCTSQKIICDSLGVVHVFYRSWDPISFQGHNAPIILCSIAPQSNLLVTISNRDFSDPPLVKVWDLSKATKRGGAPCLGSAKALLQKPSALGVAQGIGNQLFIAIGYERGEISLYRGTVSRDFSGGFKSFTVGTKSITGISFKQHGKLTDMFVCSDSGVFVYTLSENEKEVKHILDPSNVPTRCCALQTKAPNETYFMTGKDDAVYCYTSDGRGPCYALEGQKHFIQWFPNYLVIIMKATKSSLQQQKEFVLIVIDIQNKFIVFQTPIDPVVAILNEFGNCFIVTKAKQVFHLREKDIQSKLNMLFKKNLYDIALRIAKDLQFDEEGLASIYKQYADHLYIKGDYARAVERYIKTIGYIEPSYVIMKFLDSRHIKYLADYLHALYKQNQASQQHKTLLMNCRTRLDLPQKLDEFLFNEEEDSNEMIFDINAAIRNQSAATIGFQDREELKEEYNISVLLKKIQDTSEMTSMLAKLSEDDVYTFFKKFGLILMQQAPEETTRLLKRICREQEMSNFIEDHVNEVLIRFSPDQFIPLFDGKWELLLGFLESCVEGASTEFHETVYNTLVELNLRKWQNSMLTDSQLLDILKLHRSKYNKEQVLVLCRMAQFWAGILYLYEEDQLYNLTIHYYVKNKDYNSLLNCCKSLGRFQPQLWIQALNELRNDPEVPMNVLLQILNVITTEKLQSPLQILQCLAVERGPNISHVKDYYTQAFIKETTAIYQEEKDVDNLQADLKSLQELLKNFQTNPIEFRNTVCDACTQPLSLPAVYFLCQHSFHQDCVMTYSENEKDCSICSVKNQQMAERLRTQQESTGQHENFHRILNQSNDMLYVLSSYFGRGLLNQIVIVDEQKASDENQLNQNTVGYNWSAKHKDGDGPIPVEHVNNYKWSGRITNQDREQTEKQHPMPKKFTPMVNQYDDSKNPFKVDDTNPFASDDDVDAVGGSSSRQSGKRSETYDKNLNPFGDDDD
ncbi:vacuolar protein sorting-associated protein 11 homolog [Eupeodes corollae]|uniref:vacuolar protein sorting-associated protein 11 homolog n=1 Tax=Eupeodes corollae TaxID=290404 RepID=UPI002491B4CC|nr:vacuolar protein sorting-associated protein 11 homolog [Eupeodes corollae]XP_055901831.1 vacuolar protein sorting-associated protein 11 homolog [Eupeodes corollae]